MQVTGAIADRVVGFGSRGRVHQRQFVILRSTIKTAELAQLRTAVCRHPDFGEFGFSYTGSQI